MKNTIALVYNTPLYNKIWIVAEPLVKYLIDSSSCVYIEHNCSYNAPEVMGINSFSIVLQKIKKRDAIIVSKISELTALRIKIYLNGWLHGYMKNIRYIDGVTILNYNIPR